MGTDDYGRVVAELATMLDVWQRLQAEHTATPDGFCAGPGCGRPGSGVPYVLAPCGVRALADAAEAHHKATGRR